jgi:hypothetical protein
MSHESLQQQHESIFAAAVCATLCAKAAPASAIVSPSTQNIFLHVFIIISPISKKNNCFASANTLMHETTRNGGSDDFRADF